MTARIFLVRHGRSSMAHDRRWMTCDGVRGYEDAYNAAGIREDDAPPADLVAAAAAADVIAASHLVRAIASAQRIAPDREPAISELLCELYLDPPRWKSIRLPIEVWDAISFAQWSWRLWRRVERNEVRRAREAVHWLEQHALPTRTVLAITHGGFRRILDHQLRDRGWRVLSARRTHRNWSSWQYVRD